MKLTSSAKELIKEYQREYRKKNAEKLQEYQREYRKNNPQKVKEWNNNYWNRKANLLRRGD